MKRSQWLALPLIAALIWLDVGYIFYSFWDGWTEVPDNSIEVIILVGVVVLMISSLLPIYLLRDPEKQPPLWLRWLIGTLIVIAGTLAVLFTLVDSFILTVVAITLTYVMVSNLIKKSEFTRTAIWIMGIVTLLTDLYLVFSVGI